MSDFENIKRKWKHSAPWDSDDYVTEYVISGNESEPKVSGKDTSDGEAFEISDVSWSNGELMFTSFMPSTKRKGINKFKLNESGNITSNFTFTIIEELEREHT